jgi:hemolysin-activating ACP:hemolysin acyltransferase
MRNPDITTNDVVAQLLSIRSSAGYATSAAAANILLCSAKRWQTTVLKDDFERPAGYIAWACINKESYLSVLRRGKHPRYHYEWDEGQIILLADVVLYRGALRFFLETLHECFSRKRLVMFVRKNAVSVYARRDGRFRLVRRERFSHQENVPAKSKTVQRHDPL